MSSRLTTTIRSSVDVDMASYGAVAVSDLAPDGSQTWEPKEVFHAIADDFARRWTGNGRR